MVPAKGQKRWKQRQVNLSFVNASKGHYVSVSGLAAESGNRQKVGELWSLRESAWFPGEKDDPQLILLEVTPSQAEYWGRDTRKMKVLTELSMASLTGSQPDLRKTEN